MGNQQQDLFSYSRRRSYPTTPAVTRGGCMFMGCIHLLWPTVLRWQHSALYGNFKRKPWRPRPLCTDCWMDLRWLHVDCYHDSRATETEPSFQHLTAITVADSVWLHAFVHIECLLLSYRILLISLSLWILGTSKMAIIRHQCPVQRLSMWTLHTEFNKHICSWKLNCWIQNLC